MKLKSDVKSAFSNKLYGKKGDEVTVLSDRGNVMIVEGSEKNRFTVLKSQLTDMPVELKEEIITVPDATVQHKINREPVSRKKAVPINQKTLF